MLKSLTDRQTGAIIYGVETLQEVEVMEARDLVREFFDLTGQVMGRLTFYIQNAYMSEFAVLSYSADILRHLDQLSAAVLDEDLEGFLSGVIALMREFLAKVPEGWEFYELDYLREFSAGLGVLVVELGRELENLKKQKEKEEESLGMAVSDELPF
jgi:hypothetical protein